MKTHAEPKTRTPSRAQAAPVPNALAHQAQLRSALLRAGVQPRLEIGAVNDPLEREADAAAERVMRMPEPLLPSPASGRGAGGEGDLVQRSAAPTATPASPQLESSLNSLSSGGTSLDASSRAFFEPRFGQDFSQVRLHTDDNAAQMADSLNAKAFTLGNDIAFAANAYSTNTSEGKNLLGHELAHVAQGSSRNVIHRYRNASAFAFGERDTDILKEQSFNPEKDKRTKPWIELITVQFNNKAQTSGKPSPWDAPPWDTFWEGIAEVKYYQNQAAFPAFNFDVSGGPCTAKNYLTKKGIFLVHDIKGIGFNSGAYSGVPGIDYDPDDREGPKKRYTKKDSSGYRSANMSFAVFFHRGEALHMGPLDLPSHGCVHVDDWDGMQQVNYHSVIGLTKVKVQYS